MRNVPTSQKSAILFLNAMLYIQYITLTPSYANLGYAIFLGKVEGVSRSIAVCMLQPKTPFGMF